MTNKKTTRRALTTSIISLLLCVSMLVGTTFAWFTDSVTSGVNQIVAGNLDVELYHTNANVTKEVVTANTPLFRDENGEKILWEPGVVAWENLTVANLGTLALKYQMSVNFTNENTLNGNGLSKVLKVAVVDAIAAGATREAVLEAVAGKGTTLADFAKNGKLYPAGTAEQVSEQTYGIVIWWEPSAEDNNWNVNNGKKTSDGEPLHIDLGINLFATQLMAEEDSFGNTYDEDAAVFTVADANAAMAAGKDVALVNAIEPEGILVIPADYTGTLTLHNVTVASVMEETGAATTAEETTETVSQGAKIVILGNVKVVATEEGMSAITGTNLNISGSGTLTAEAKGDAAFGIGGMTTKSINIEGITIAYVAGGHAYGVGPDTKYYKDAPEGGAAIGSGMNGAVITLKGVTVTKAIGGSKAAAIGARYHTGVTVNIQDSTIAYAEGGVSAAGIGGSRVSNGASENGTTVNIVNSTVTAVGGAYGAGIGSGYDTHCQAKQPMTTVNITDSTINAQGGKYAAGVGSGYHNAALSGEIKNSTVNATSGEKVYKASYTPAMDIGFGVVDPTREGQQTSSKLIYNGVEITLTEAPSIVSSGDDLTAALEKGENVVLEDDVKMESATTAPYGNKYGVALNGGVLDGNGNELYMECYGDDYGIMTTGGTIKNLTIQEGCRAVMIMYPTQDIILDNVNIGGNGVLYPINTGEHATKEGVDLIVTNSVLAGWTSYAGIESASFTNVDFKQGTYYNNIYGRVLKPYVNTTLTNCSFVAHMNLDLSGLEEGQKIVIKNCTVDGQAVTADVFTIPTSDADYDTELFTVDLPSWASSVADCISFE